MYDLPGSGKGALGRPLFTLGRVVATPGALACLERCGVNGATLLQRHQTGDWGDISAEDCQQNKLAITHGCRILSSYTMSSGERIWIITEADRSSTTLLRPEEY